MGPFCFVSGSSARPRYQTFPATPNLPPSLGRFTHLWPRVIGKVPDEVSFEEAKAAARSTGISILSIVKGALGSLDHVKRVVKR